MTNYLSEMPTTATPAVENSGAANHGQEPRLLNSIFRKIAEKHYCRCNRALLAHTSHRHAQVLRFDEDSDPFWGEVVGERSGYLRRHGFLCLKPPGEDIHDPCDF